jgi:hypothetical protein
LGSNQFHALEQSFEVPLVEKFPFPTILMSCLPFTKFSTSHEIQIEKHICFVVTRECHYRVGKYNITTVKSVVQCEQKNFFYFLFNNKIKNIYLFIISFYIKKLANFN